MLSVQPGSPGTMTAHWLLPILLAAVSASAQSGDSADAAEEHGFPWIARSSVDMFYLGSPAEAGKDQPYQVSLYQGFTIQSLTFAWFHIGLRSRETLAPGFSAPYREPFEVKVQGSAELLRDYLFVTLGGNIPIQADSVATVDTLALYRAMNGYSPLPNPSFLSPRALQAALYARYAWTNWTLLGGFGYTRATLFEPVRDRAFFPAAYFDFSGRAVYQSGSTRHRWDAKVSLYGDEGNSVRIPAHNEGDLYQVRYEYLKSRARIAWQTGVGAAVKLPDANRRLRLKSELLTPETDENIQRTYLELSLSWAPHPGILWRFYAAPKALFSWSGSLAGHETEGGLALGLRVWETHRIRIAGSMLYGNVDGKAYTGFGMHGEFAFRHLGFQDFGDDQDNGDSR